MTLLAALAGLALLAWLAVLLLPWQPHRVRERLEAEPSAAADLADVCVLIPARDEAAVIGATLAALRRQGRGLAVVVVDDESRDGTAEAARRAAAEPAGEPIELEIVAGAPLPTGWAGKLWALEQGFARVQRPFTLLLDADIELAPNLVPALERRAAATGATLVSVMAELDSTTFWERLLVPPFVFFFKLLYPFALANLPASRVAAAAGGCMLVETRALRALGGFAAVRDALIDDCTLAAALKRAGGTIWLGMSHSVQSRRVYAGLGEFWSMVSRSAFTQLRYSPLRLLGATVALVVVLLVPPGAALAAAVGAVPAEAGALGALAWLAAAGAYLPLVRFYGLPAIWALTLPVAGALFLAMTWDSALRYWRGTRARWKNRSYGIANR